MTGSTGNIYTVRICQRPTCTCPHYQQGNQCKHWLWVMSRVLRADFKHVYQLALLSDELRAIFATAPPIEGPDAAGDDRNRKPVEGDCPICYSELEEPGHAEGDIVWCRAACGNNVHRKCFETWARTKRTSGGGDVTCPLCRSVWEGDNDMVKRIQKTGPVNSDGYVNVADQLGINPHRGTCLVHSMSISVCELKALCRSQHVLLVPTLELWEVLRCLSLTVETVQGMMEFRGWRQFTCCSGCTARGLDFQVYSSKTPKGIMWSLLAITITARCLEFQTQFLQCIGTLDGISTNV